MQLLKRLRAYRIPKYFRSGSKTRDKENWSTECCWRICFQYDLAPWKGFVNNSCPSFSAPVVPLPRGLSVSHCARIQAPSEIPTGRGPRGLWLLRIQWARLGSLHPVRLAPLLHGTFTRMRCGLVGGICGCHFSFRKNAPLLCGLN